MDEIDLTRAETVQPRGYNAHRITESPTDVDWQDVTTYVPNDPGDVPVVLPRRVVEDVIRDLGAMRLDAALASDGGEAHRLHRLQRVLMQFLGGALVAALAVAGLVAAAPTTQAQAAEGPQPDPAPAATYKVVLGPAPVQVLVHATVYARTTVGGDYYCASVWVPSGLLSRACSLTPDVEVPVGIDPRTWPAGRRFAQVVDDSSDVAVSTIVFDARRPSKFGRGYYEDRGAGDLYVRVPVFVYSLTQGRWVGQSRSPVRIDELTRRGWRTRATLWTNPPGLAAGLVHLGGGLHVIRAVRPDGSVWGVTGSRRLVDVTEVSFNID